MRIKTILAALIAAVVIGGSASAQQGDNTPTAGQTVSPASGTLTTADIPKLLDGMGYEYEKLSDGTCRLTIHHDTWKFKIDLSLSSNSKKFWISSYLVQIKDMDQVPASLLVKLMLKNSDIGPAHFCFCKLTDAHKQQTTWLEMEYALDNRDLTLRLIREGMDKLVGYLSETSDLWSPLLPSDQTAK